MKRIIISFFCLCPAFFFAVLNSGTVYATGPVAGQMSYYCQTPPTLQPNIPPNLLLMIDNSASQYDLANIDPASYTTGTYCYDASYNDSTVYPGYFDTNTIYSYDSTNTMFVGGSTLPGSCTYGNGTNYACVNISSGTTQFVARGNFLNWLSASKLDIQKKILTGGKYVGGNLIGESRGCDGARFIKTVPSMSGITFAVRGPNSFQAAYVNQSSQGGQTLIEIYTGSYGGSGCTPNSNCCLQAVYDWQNNVSHGTTKGDTEKCLGVTSGNPMTQQLERVYEYNHIINNCYWYFQNHSMSNDNALQNECVNNVYPFYTSPSVITGSAGDAICSSGINDPYSYSASGPTAGKGYIGICWNNGAWDDACTIQEMTNFCNGITASPVTDPSEVSIQNTTGNTALNVPAFVLDAGLNNPGLQLAGTFRVQISTPAPPTGLINAFSGKINFGAMIFNTNGSYSECMKNGGCNGSTTTCIPCPGYCSANTSQQCYLDQDCSGGTCVVSSTPPNAPTTNMDGGHIISYVSSSVGDHSSRLINAIDNISASTWTPFAEAFYDAIGYFANRTDLRLNTTDFDATKPPSQYTCQKNNILLVTDGMSTADQNLSVLNLAALYANGDTQVGGYDPTTHSCGPAYSGSMALDNLAWLAKNRNIKTFSTSSPASTDQPTAGSQYITTYTIFTGTSNGAYGECDPKNLLMDTATKGGTLFQTASNYKDLVTALRTAFSLVAAEASSGTAASVLASSAGSGANILQAVFYPNRQFDNNTSTAWTGALRDLWYYLDPSLLNSSIREDTYGNKILDLSNDYRLVFYFDPVLNKTRVQRYQDTLTQDTSGNEIYKYVDTVDIEGIGSLWEAGTLLWSRDLKNSPRTIYYSTTDNNGHFILGNFTTANASALAITPNLINYVTGYDNVCSGTTTGCIKDADCNSGAACVSMGYRNRTVTINPSSSVSISSVWRLGDIISSTPKVQSSIALDSYQLAPPLGYNDTTYSPFIGSKDYKTRGMAYAGANDGMLHAFKLGTIDQTVSVNQKASLCDDTNGDGKCESSEMTSYSTLGQEQWAFIPKNALPYLEYLSDPGYCHLYYIDGPAYIFDASIANGGYSGNYWDAPKQTQVDSNNNLVLSGTTWRTVLVGSMGAGGACRDYSGSCNTVAGLTGDQCVKTPVPGNGFSSYFALDVTSPQSPALLWEFSDPALGFSVAGPAIVKISAKQPAPAITTPDNLKNGRWFAVLASGPTGPIDSSTNQFQGASDQNLKLFVLDLASGSLIATIDTGIPNAFASSVFNSPLDVDRWNSVSNGFYQDDVFYIGYTQLSGTTWSAGGVLRVSTRDNIDPAQWQVSTVISGIGPVTTSIAKLQDKTNGELWLYFGTGRFFYKTTSTLDDKDSIRTLYGVKDPCYLSVSNTFDGNCTSSVSGLTDKSSSPSDSEPGSGWYINLSASSSTYGAERVITDPVAAPNGVVFFTTYQPATDPCSLGGNSYIWALGYNTGSSSICFSNCPSGSLGASVTRPVSTVNHGKAMIQVSTGSIQEVSLAGAFTQSNSRQTLPIAGVPPKGQGLSIVINPKPLKKILHIREK